MAVHIHGLVVLTGLGCTLRCRDCGNHMPYIPSADRRPKPVTALREDLARLAGRLTCDLMQLQGGEPLVHPQLPEIIQAAHQSGIASRVMIATSASLPLREAVLDACARHNVLIRLSDYGIAQQRLAEYEDRFRKAGVECYRYGMASGNGTWLDLGGMDMARSDDDALVRERFRTCPFNSCWTLYDGRITRCSRAASTHVSGLHPFFPEDFVEIRDAVDTLDARLSAFVSSDRFLEACRYCRGRLAKTVTAGVQLPLRTTAA